MFQEPSFPWVIAAVAVDSSKDLSIPVSGDPNTRVSELGFFQISLTVITRCAMCLSFCFLPLQIWNFIGDYVSLLFG